MKLLLLLFVCVHKSFSLFTAAAFHTALAALLRLLQLSGKFLFVSGFLFVACVPFPFTFISSTSAAFSLGKADSLLLGKLFSWLSWKLNDNNGGKFSTKLALFN